MKRRKVLIFLSILTLTGMMACTSTELVESPKTTVVPEVGTPADPKVIWTSRTLARKFDYLGRVNTRAWTYDAGLEKLIEGGKELRADAIIDVHFERVGFLKTFHAFAIKFAE